ncbi:MAG TPA: hypothetical protein VL418_04935 [Devosiaceae bacterium]|nr:hypothetical protein [Devosiaceae bacterium]
MTNGSKWGVRLAGLVLAGALALSGARAQDTGGLTVNLPPTTDYKPFCKVKPAPQLSTDWSAWKGDKASVVPEQMYQDATIYLDGAVGGPLRNVGLAERMFDFLAKSDWLGRSAALYQLGRLQLDDQSGMFAPQVAVTTLKQAIALGNTNAATLLGKTYLNGTGLPRDLAAAESDLKVGANGNDVDAVIALAQLNYSYSGDPARIAAGDNYLKLALTMIYRGIGAGDCGLLNSLGDIFANPGLRNFDLSKAVAWYQAAYNTGDVEGAINLARYYGDRQSAIFDPAKAAAYLQFAAQAGRVTAMVDLAELLLRKTDADEAPAAVDWLDRAAANGEISAYDVLVGVAQGVYGGKADANRAFGYLERASRLPNVTGELLAKLAKAQATGYGTAGDRVAAYQTYKRAAAIGNNGAYVALYDLIAAGVSEPGDRAQDFLQKGVDAGLPAAMARMGAASMCGFGVNRDPVLAQQWYERAAAAGDPATLVALAKREQKNGNTPGYLDYIKRGANVGDGEAMILLAKAFADGEGMPADLDTAKSWRQKALGDATTRPTALLTLARLAMAGDGKTPPDLKAAHDLLQESAAIGNAAAAYDLASLVAKGFPGSPPDAVAALPFFVDAAQQGSLTAMLRLVDLHVSAADGGLDWQAWLARASASGSVRALLLDAAAGPASDRHVLYDRLLSQSLCDPGDVLDVAKVLAGDVAYHDAAARLAIRATEMQPTDPSELYQLADLIGNGLLGQQREGEAIPYLQRAAEAGKVEAMRELGKAYLTGANVGKDDEQGRKWLLAAVTAGDQGAIKTISGIAANVGLDTLGIDGIVSALKAAEAAKAPGSTAALASVLSQAATIDPHYQAQAVEWLQRAAGEGDGDSMLELSNAYALGIGVAKSDEQSAAWLKRAADAGFTEAYPKYAMVLELGLGTPQDSKQALYWMNKSTQNAPQ